MDKEKGDARKWVPRCIGGSGGNISLDAINKKVSGGVVDKEEQQMVKLACSQLKSVLSVWCQHPSSHTAASFCVACPLVHLLPYLAHAPHTHILDSHPPTSCWSGASPRQGPITRSHPRCWCLPTQATRKSTAST